MPTVMTCGVYGFSAETFEKAIVKANPDVFVDVRMRRGVRGHDYAFANSKRLQEMLAEHDITYIHKKGLAPAKKIVEREGEIDAEHHIARHERDSLSDEFVENYTKQVLDSFDAQDLIDELDNPKSILLFCVEETAAACHRGLLAEAVVKQLDWKRKDLEP